MASNDVRLRMDGLFELKAYAVQFTREFTALYTNGPAGGGGIRSSSHWLPNVFVHILASSLRNFTIDFSFLDDCRFTAIAI